MSRQTLTGILFWSLATVSVALFVMLILVVGGAIPIDSPSEPAATSTEALPASPPAATSEQTPTEPPAEPAPTTTATAAPPATTPLPASAATLVVVTASRGNSWFSARVGSENGRVLDERVLAQGESAQFRGPRIWLSVGAAGNVDVTVDGKPRALSPGTVSIVLTPSRTAAASS